MRAPTGALNPAKGWQPRAISRWLLVLATTDNDHPISEKGEALPCRASAMTEADEAISGWRWIDPGDRRRRWLIATWVDGRRRSPPSANYRDAATRVGR